jgi:acetoin utilization protein AcuA
MVRSNRVLGNMATLEGSNVVIAFTDVGKIVGYTVFGYPSRLERWGTLEDKLLYELGSVEVSRNWRSMGIAKKMIELGMEEEWLESKILFLTGFAWHWDLDNTNMSRMQYREYLMRLYGRFGFRHVHTNEPNIRMDLANFLMARVGSNVSDEDYDRFIGLCFDTEKDEL